MADSHTKMEGLADEIADQLIASGNKSFETHFRLTDDNGKPINKSLIVLAYIVDEVMSDSKATGIPAQAQVDRCPTCGRPR
jgi:hypothetical protein